MTSPANHDATGAALEALGRRLRRRTALLGLARWSAAVLPAALAAVWAVGGPQRPATAVLGGLGLLILAGGCLLWLRWISRPLRPLTTPRDVARVVERSGDHRNLLTAAEEAARAPERWPADDAVSAELGRRVARRAAEALARLDVRGLVPLTGLRTAGAVVAVTLAALSLVLVQAPGDLQRGADRLLDPYDPPVPEPSGGIYAEAGEPFVVAGSDLDIGALDFGDGLPGTVCEVRHGRGGWQEVPVAMAHGPTAAGASEALYRRWTATIPDVQEDLSWRFRNGTRVTAAVPVAVRRPPLLTRLAASVQPPAYTGLPAQQLPRLPRRLEVPAGSIVELEGRASHPLSRAGLVDADGDTVPLAPVGDRVEATVPVHEDRHLRLALTDSFGLVNTDAPVHALVAVPDAPPAAGLRREDDDGILPPAAAVVLLLSAADDYGLASLDLLLRVSGEGSGEDESWRGGRIWPGAGAEAVLSTGAGDAVATLLRPDPAGSDLQLDLHLNLDTQQLNLVAGEALEIVLEATDNKTPGEPNRTRSRVLRLVLPSAADVLTAQAEASEQRRGHLEQMRSRSAELEADLDRLTRELMKNPVPDWARQKEMETAIQRQKTMQDELSRVAAELQRELEKLATNQLTSEDQLERAEQMSQLLQQNSSANLQNLLERLESGEGDVSPQDVTRAMGEVTRQQKEMARRLDAALALLQRMAEEQEMAGLVALLEKMIQKQQELADLSRELAEQRAREDGAADPAGGEPPESGTEDRAAGDEPESGEHGEESPASESGDHPESEADQPPADAGEAPMGESPAPDAEELARRQQALREEMAELQEKLEEALAELRERNAEKDGKRERSAPGADAGEQMEQALQQALEQLQEQQDAGSMDQAAEALDQMEPGDATEFQERALRDLGSLYNVLLKSQAAMQAAMKMEQVASLRGLAADMLSMSARQEVIAERIPAGLRDVRALDLTRDQHRVQLAAENVREGLTALLDDAPNRIMRLLEKLDEISEEMGRSLRAMEENRATAARSHARTSLAAANRMVISLLTEAQMKSNSGGAAGQPSSSLSEQLQQMIQEQAGLNGATEELRRMLADRGISQAERARMQRLGQSQAELAQRMGELAEREREAPEGDRLLGDLEDLGAEMESIGREVDQGLVSEDTLVRQERILSRMLDARNSVRRRDYSRKREGEAAEDVYARQSGRAGAEADDEDDPFRQRYRPLEEAPLEYRELIRRYFTAVDSLRRAAGPLPEATP